jgi:hypothetical protein
VEHSLKRCYNVISSLREKNMTWFINLGINSTSSMGYRTGQRTIVDGTKRYGTTKAKGRKTPLPLSDEEVRFIRKLDEVNIPRKQIFDDHVKGKMTYHGMINILEGITRTNVF